MKNGSTAIYYEVKGNYWGDYKKNLTKVTENAHKSGLKTMLKPHIFVEGVGWAGTLNYNAKNWAIWEANFERKILDFAQFAADNKIEIFCIGVELKSAAARNPEFFRALIKKVRVVYKGKLTYAANWDNYTNVKFWDALDFIGIDGYFPISTKKTPSIEDLKRGWNRVLPKLEAFSNKTKKKIIFTEFGYRSCDYSIGKQWEIEKNKAIPINNTNQINGYTVFFEQVYTSKFIAGGFLWKWFGNEKDLELLPKNNYTPQHKPVEQIIKKWYKKY